VFNLLKDVTFFVETCAVLVCADSLLTLTVIDLVKTDAVSVKTAAVLIKKVAVSVKIVVVLVKTVTVL